MIKEEHIKASKPFRTFLCQLLEKDVNQRLGKNLSQFINHDFFRDFDWNADVRLDQEFLDSIPSYEKNKIHKKLSEMNSLLPSYNQKFHYDIQGFTYENEDLKKSTKP